MRYFVIKAEKVSKNYSHRQGIEDISFEVEPGEIFGLLGNDHAGKSTLFSLLAGYFRPTSGNLLVFGLDSQREARQIHEFLEAWLRERFPYDYFVDYAGAAA